MTTNYERAFADRPEVYAAWFSWLAFREESRNLFTRVDELL